MLKYFKWRWNWTLETCNCHVTSWPPAAAQHFKRSSTPHFGGPRHGSALLQKLAEHQNFRSGCICRPQLNAEGDWWDLSVTSVRDCNSIRKHLRSSFTCDFDSRYRGKSDLFCREPPVENSRWDYCWFITVKLLPQCVKNCSIVPDSEQLIWGRYPVRVSVLWIPKDSVGEPNKPDHIANGVRERKRHFSRDIIHPKFLWIFLERKQQLHSATRG